MTKVVHLHVGGPKTGTTFIQQVLEHNAEALGRVGVLVAGPRLDLIHAAMVVRDDHRLDSLPAEARGAWRRVVDQVRDWSGDVAVVSYELFANATADQVARALADLDDIEVHVVITARDLGKAIASSWQEQLKFGITKKLGQWRPPQESNETSEWGWRTLQPANVARRWGATLPADQVHVVTVPRGNDNAELWRRFADACGLSAVPGLDLAVERANESLGVVQAEVLRRVNGALEGRIKGGRAKSLWLRDLFAHQVLAPLGREAIGLTDQHLAQAQAEYDAAVADITAAGYRVHGDLTDLAPTRAGSRLPEDVSDHEVAESAALALADLLVWARAAGADVTVPPGEEGEAPTSPARGAKGLVRSSVARIAAPLRDRQVEALQGRIAALEAEVERGRRLHLRVATLTDVVQQLLLPAGQRDEEVTQEALRIYRERSL